MTNETRRRQMRAELMAKAKMMQEAYRKSSRETFKKIDEARRSLKRPYAPEVFAAEIRNLFGDSKRTATIGE